MEKKYRGTRLIGSAKYDFRILWSRCGKQSHTRQRIVQSRYLLLNLLSKPAPGRKTYDTSATCDNDQKLYVMTVRKTEQSSVTAFVVGYDESFSLIVNTRAVFCFSSDTAASRLDWIIRASLINRTLHAKVSDNVKRLSKYSIGHCLMSDRGAIFCATIRSISLSLSLSLCLSLKIE